LDATILVVTHNIALARSLPDNIGMLFRRSLVTFGPREVLLTTEEPVIDQFLTGRRAGPIGMSEEKDAATMSRETELGIVVDPGEQKHGLTPQIQPPPGLPPRASALRHRDRLNQMWHTLSPTTQQEITAAWADEQVAV